MKRTEINKITDDEKKQLAGHRDRLKNRFLTQDSDYMDDSRMLELLLTYAIPRIDTYPLANRLIHSFGDLDGVFSASIDSLCTVSGIGRNTAILIKLIPSLNRKCMLSRNKRVKFENIEQIAQKICSMFIGETEEKLLIATYNSKMEVMSYDWSSEGNANECTINKRKLTQILVREGVSHAVIAHNHPSGDITPSQADYSAMSAIKQIAENSCVDLLDILIVSGNQYIKYSDIRKIANRLSSNICKEFSYLYNTCDLDDISEFTSTVIKNEHVYHEVEE